MCIWKITQDVALDAAGAAEMKAVNDDEKCLLPGGSTVARNYSVSILIVLTLKRLQSLLLQWN